MPVDSPASYDVLLVGQGIAGTVLAQVLLRRGKKILVIDNWNYSTSSKVAAGLYNPIVFKRLTKSWMIDELLPAAEFFYSEFEKILGEQFFYKKEILKIFSEQSEQVFWLKKAQEVQLKNYLTASITENFIPDRVHNPMGAAVVKRAGNVDVVKMLNLFRARLKASNLLVEEQFNYNELIVHFDKVLYKNIQANKIIFCEGFRVTENPWFNWLPFKLTKGEILTIRTSSALKEEDEAEPVINKGVFILPLGNCIYKVGATYNWDQLDELPTEKGKAELLEKLRKVILVPFEVLNQEAGIRPTVLDRRPLIGLHPLHNSLGVFNGMGTKGILLAPYFANQLADFLDGIAPIAQEADIFRCWKKETPIE